MRIRHGELRPGDAAIGAEHAALFPTALVDRQPNGTVGGDMEMAMQTATIRSARRVRAQTIVSQNSRAVARTKRVAPLAGCRANNILRAVINRFALVPRRAKHSERRWIRTAADRLVVGATVGRCHRTFYVRIAIVVRVGVDRVRTDGRIGDKGAPRLLVRPKNRIQSG